VSHRVEELLRRGLERFEAGDEEGMAELYHPEIEVWSGEGNTGTFHGREGALRWGREWNEAWEEIHYEPIEFIELSEDVVVVPIKVRARARAGLELEGEFAWLFELEDDMLKRWELHAERHAAIASAKAWLAARARR
jgi:ketosteroid isomerase-like protein